MKKKIVKNIGVFGFIRKLEPPIKKAARAVLKHEGKKTYRINFILVSNAEIKELNTTYRNTPQVTDVIAFLIDTKLMIGDIYIADERLIKQAEYFGNTLIEEVMYLSLHGVLHLCGYSDYDEQNKKKMFEVQDKLYKCLFS
ncbi:MAG: rRNA maturation RNase YbeY [Elusimicrobiota bacterium]|jgi:probable rRNA maturation factor|nr:rRNA maturation RNase YbeY [Elusimicrobiota bacterium]